MSILHISNAFAQSGLYTHLVFSLDNLDIDQIVYSAVRSRRESEFSPEELTHIPKYLQYILNSRDRLLYHKKIQKISDNLLGVVDTNDVDLIHAHTLYSDGGVAFTLYKNLGIPYIVAIRNTDINMFMKYRPDLNKIRNNILFNAEKVILISPAYKKKIKNLLPKKVLENIQDRVTVIPNGIAPQWFGQINSRPKKEAAKTLRLLFVGAFTKNKNLLMLIRAVSRLSQTDDISLTLVGGGGNYHDKVLQLVDSGDCEYLTYLGRVNDIEKLKKICQAHDLFVMPSFHETFGLVYIEALSQGLPIIYSKGEGVDGYFPNGSVGEAVDPKDINDLVNKINLLSGRMNSVRRECVEQSRRFKWKNIALQYKKIYMKHL